MNIWTCASALRADINYYAGDGAGSSLVADGDRILIPDGSIDFNGAEIHVTKALHIRGMNAVLDPTYGWPTSCGTTIKDSISGRGQAFNFDTALGKNWRLSHLSFAAGTETTTSAAFFGVSGYSVNNRVDHCLFNVAHTDRLFSWGSGAPLVLIDHCQGQIANLIISPNAQSWKGVGDFGDNSWATVNNWGSRDFIYMEDVSFTGNHQSMTDGYQGARWAYRFAYIYNAQLGTHGTESSLRERGTRSCMVCFTKHNTDTVNDIDMLFLRSGVAILHHTDSVNYYRGIHGYDYRGVDDYPPWGSIDGLGPFDLAINGIYDFNSTTGFNGTDGAVDLLTDTTKIWTPSQWAPNPNTALGFGFGGGTCYAVRNLTQGWSSFIVDNGANTITTAPSLGSPHPSHVWHTGDLYVIRQAYPALDQTGWGKGDLLSGGTMGPPPTPPTTLGWPNQLPELCYAFSNTHNNLDGFYECCGGSPNINVGRDMAVTKGTGPSGGVWTKEGTYAQMQAEAGAVEGCGWWVTDRGGWNAATNPLYTGQGQFWKYISGVWTFDHEPLAYPHPLIAEWDSFSGGGPSGPPIMPQPTSMPLPGPKHNRILSV